MRKSATALVFPAHAGMNPGSAWVDTHAGSFPRTRGDEHGAQLLQIASRVDTLDDHAHDVHREIYLRLSKLER